MSNQPHVDAWAVPLVLLAALWQTGLGARFSPTGEQVGLALPVSTLALVAATAWLLWRRRQLPLPAITARQTAFLCLSSVGLLGLTVAETPAAVRELVQLFEIALLSPYFAMLVVDRVGWSALNRAFAACCGVVLVLGATGVGGTHVVGLSPTKATVFALASWPFLLVSSLAWISLARIAALVGGSVLLGLTVSHGWFLLVWFVLFAGVQARLRVRRWSLVVLCFLLAAAASCIPRPGRPEPWSELSPYFRGTHLKRFYIEVAAALRAPAHYPLGGGLGRYKPTINQLKQYGSVTPHPEDMKVPRDGNCQYLLTLTEAGLPAMIALVVWLAGAAAVRRPREGAGEDERLGGVAVQAALVGLLLAALFCVVLSRGLGIWVGVLVGLSAAFSPPVRDRARWFRLGAVAGCVSLALAGMFSLNSQPVSGPDPSDANRLLQRWLFRGSADAVSGLRVIVLPDDVAGPGADSVIQVEGEAFVSKTYPFLKVQANGASGNWVLAIPDKMGKGIGQAIYAVEVPEAGQYRLYARVFWEDGCSNSVEFRLGTESVVFASELFGQWHVLDAKRPMALDKGPLKVEVRNLEDGIRVDYWGLRRCSAP
jgi:hypothetical protein